MTRLEVTPERLVLRAPLPTSWGELREREILRVRLSWSDDDFGLGEAAPLELYDGVSRAAVSAALQVYASVLRDIGPHAGHAELLAACAAERDLPHALAAIDLALWDRAGRRAGRPVAHLLAAGAAEAVEVSATLGAEDRAEAAAQAAAAVRAGFSCVKVKVGIGVDANGAWSNPHESLANLRALAAAGLEYAEEPVHGVDALRAVQAASRIAIAMDESAIEPGAAGSGATRAVCLKIARCGGISGLLRDARDARAAGSGVYVASTFDGALGVAAGVHAAAALAATGPVAPCGLATLGMFEGYEDVLAPVHGAIAVPEGPGLL